MSSQRDVKAGGAYVELGTRDKLARGLKNAQSQVRKFAAEIGQIGTQMMGMGAAIVAPLTAAAKVFSSMGDQLHKMAKRTGLTVEALSELKYVAKLSGTSVESLENGLRRMQMTVNDAGRGLSTARDALAALGLSLNQLQGLAPEEQFKLFADGLSKIPDATTRAATAMMVFGRSGTALLPMMEHGVAWIEAMQTKAREMGLTISTESAEAAAKFTDEMTTLWESLQIAAFELGNSLTPAIIDFAEDLRETIRGTIAWVKENREMIVTIAKVGAGLLVAGAAMTAVGKILGGLAAPIKLASSAVGLLRVAMTALADHPVVLAVAAITAAVAALGYGIYKLINAEDDLAARRRKQHEERRRQLSEQKRLIEQAEQERRRRLNRIVMAEQASAEGLASYTAADQTARQRAAAKIRADAEAQRALLMERWNAEAGRPGGADRSKLQGINDAMKLVNRTEAQRLASLTREDRAERWQAFAAEQAKRVEFTRSQRAEELRAIQDRARKAVEAGAADSLTRLIANDSELAGYKQRRDELLKRASEAAGDKRAKLLQLAGPDLLSFARSVSEGKWSPNALAGLGQSVRGTFSSERLEGLGVGGNLAAQQLDVQKKMQKDTKAIAKNTKAQLAFGP